MKNAKLTRLQYALGAIAVIAILGIGGSVDRAEQVVYNMPEKAYNDIRKKLGEEATLAEIASEYENNYKRDSTWK